MAPARRFRIVALAALLLVAAPGASASLPAGAAIDPTQASRPAGPPGPGPYVAPEDYYRPVVAGGKTFPLARAYFLSLIQIHRNWHAPRLRLVGGRWELIGVHEGIDISAERGTPILSMTYGRVENVGWTFYSGTRVGIRGSDGRYYFYAHLSAVAPGIAPGDSVSAGTPLGLVGNTGYGDPGHRDTFPPHLHFGIETGDTWVNPYPLLISLYRAAVAADRRVQAHLDALQAEGRRAAWRDAAGAAFTDFGLA